MYLVRSHGLMYIQVPHKGGHKPELGYNGRDFIPPVPALNFRDLRYVGREVTIYIDKILLPCEKGSTVTANSVNILMI